MARGSWLAGLSKRGPGLFPAAMRREKKKKRMIEKTEESENNNRSRRSRLFLCDNKGHMIFQPPLQPAGQRFLLSPQHPTPPPTPPNHHHLHLHLLALFCSQSCKDDLPRYKDLIFFLLSCYTEHSNLIRPFDKHLTQSSGLLSRLPTAQGKRLRLTNFHPQFSLF